MNRNIIYFCLCGLLLNLLTACEEGDLRDPKTSTRGTANIMDVTDGTELGQRHVGIFVSFGTVVLPSLGNVEYQIDEGQRLKPSNPNNAIWLISEFGAVNFEAYAPYQSGMDATDPAFTIADWSRQDDLLSLDLLVADRVENRSVENPDVNLQFRHIASKVRLCFGVEESSGLTASEMEGMTVSLSNVNRPIEYRLLTHEVSYADTSLPQEVQLAVNGEQLTAVAILPPEQVGKYCGENRQFTIQLRNGTVYRWSIPDEQILAAGTCTTWKLMVSTAENVEIQDCTIKDWNDKDMGDLELTFDE